MAELTSSTRELARRIGLSESALRKAESIGRIRREPNGEWDVEKTRAAMIATADPARSPLAYGGGAGGQQHQDGTPYARLRVANLALKVESQRLALDHEKGKLIDAQAANDAIDEIAGSIRDALLNWPARVSGLIAAELGADAHRVQTVLQKHITDLLTEAADRFDPPAIGDRPADH